MKKTLKWLIGTMIFIVTIIYIGNYILWGIGMGTIHNPQLSTKGKGFIKGFTKDYPHISFYFMHRFDINQIPNKTAPADIVLEPLNAANDFNKLSIDSLSNFSYQLNDKFQLVLNYKQAYDSLHIKFLHYQDRIIYKEYVYPVE